MLECCKIVPKEDHEVDPETAAGPRVRVIFEMPWNCRDWPGDSMLSLLVRNETQDKTVISTVCRSELYDFHNRAHLNAFQPTDELNVYVYNIDKGGIQDGFVEKIPIPGDQIQEALASVKGPKGAGQDVMVVCTLKIRFSAYEWMREINLSAQLIDKGAELFVPGRPLIGD